jgi:hypothetical protein
MNHNVPGGDDAWGWMFANYHGFFALFDTSCTSTSLHLGISDYFFITYTPK